MTIILPLFFFLHVCVTDYGCYVRKNSIANILPLYIFHSRCNKEEREREGKATLIVPHISGNGASCNMNLFIKSHIKNYSMAVV